MSSKNVTGDCKICGKVKKLTFEHVPPEITFNSYPVKMITGETLINTIGENERLPWKYHDLKGRISQRGRGGYFLCEDCNSITGSWYVPSYSQFIYGIHDVLMRFRQEEYSALHIFAKEIKPLAIFKQIMVMFCDINHGCMGDNSIKEFILNKESKNFDKDKFRLFAYIHDGDLERMNGISCLIISGVGVVTITEISTYPMGFALYINLPKNYKPKGVEITSFVDYRYEDVCNVEMSIPKLESNIIFSGDYRTKKEILDCIDENRIWEEEHKIEIE